MLRAALWPICREGSLLSRHRSCLSCGRPSLAVKAVSSANAPLSAAFLAVHGLQQQLQQPPASSLHTSPAGGRRSSSLGLWKNLMSIRHGPAPALLLGVAGLAPFVLVPASMLASGCYDSQLVTAQTIYGATVLAFLGGVRWGAALPDSSPVKPSWFNLTTSVMPPLLSWAALLLPQPWPLPAVLCSLLGALYSDLQLLDYPAWFRGLRLLLSTVAVACLALSIVCWVILPSEKDHKSTTSLSLTTTATPEVVAQGGSDATQKGSE